MEKLLPPKYHQVFLVLKLQILRQEPSAFFWIKPKKKNRSTEALTPHTSHAT